jgi:ATP phosphoribosyltransferase regulatory subunit HisZ
VLRPDSTIPVARAAAEGGLSWPARLYYVQNVFRFSETEDREDWQCGIEFLGAPAVLGDLEVAAVGCETLEALGMRPRVRLGHAGASEAVAGALVASGVSDVQPALDRIAAEGLGALRDAACDRPQVAAFVELASRASADLSFLANLKALATGPLAAVMSALEELERVARALADSGRQVVVDPGMPHDFAYYTGVVFEFRDDDGAWGRGGRYAPAGEGAPATACGMGLDLGRLLDHIRPTTRIPAAVPVVPRAPADVTQAMAVARALHRSGIPAAFAAETGEGRLAVVIESGRMVACTPGGEQEMRTLDDLVGLLVLEK